MNAKDLRDESTEEKKRIWEEVDQAASHAPRWVISRIMSREQVESQNKHQGNTEGKRAGPL